MKTSRRIRDLNIALVHDDLVQWGGAERVLVALSEIFPQAPIYTSVFHTGNKLLRDNFQSKKIITSFIQKIPGWKKMYKALLPLYPLAFEQFDFSGFDLVISHSTRFAKSVITKNNTKHLCYCPTPPRFLWNFSKEKVFSLLSPYLSFLRIYDQCVAKKIDIWVANSRNVKDRIKKVYGASASVIYPFVDIGKFSKVQPFEGGYLLVVSRLNKYKRVDLVIEAANKSNVYLKVVGNGPDYPRLTKMAGPTVEFLGSVSEKLLSILLAGCKAVVVAGEEDFGMVSLEAQAVGKPVIAYKKGGSLETVIHGVTGYFFELPTVESLIGALALLDKYGYNQKRCQSQARKFSKERFMREFRTLVSSI